jgi:hypothetical protein
MSPTDNWYHMKLREHREEIARLRRELLEAERLRKGKEG